MDAQAKRTVVALACALACTLGLAAHTSSGSAMPDDPAPAVPELAGVDREQAGADPGREPGEEPQEPQPADGTVQGSGEITLAFAGDVHFELHMARLLEQPRGALGPIARTLREADLTMLNLESAITLRGRPDPKELEDAGNRYHFRTSPRALEVLAEAGVDVVSMANNHVGDYGQVGLRDTLAAAREAPVEVVGIGRDRAAAFAPYRASVKGLDVAFLAADTVFREGSSDVWAAGPDSPGAAAARTSRPAALLDAVRSSAEQDDLVVVYLHWGREQQSCPTQRQRMLARSLSEAGADVVLGTHSHVLGGAGWSGATYVGYGLGNFVWYHDRQPDTGVLTLRLTEDGVVSDKWTPAVIAPGGRPRPVTGPARAEAIAAWRGLRGCTGLARTHGGEQVADPAYSSSIRPIGPALAERMASSHRPGCPVPLRDLRYLQMTYRNFDGQARTGEMVVHRRYARGVTEAFGRMYAAGWPIARMRLVDDYGGDDDRSMAANNTSAFNCRRVAGERGWSAHAYGAAIDINPVQNPYLRPGSVEPPNGRPFARIDRRPNAPVPAGVIRSGELPVVALARLGWEWGGDWVVSPDYQHVAARDFRRLAGR